MENIRTQSYWTISLQQVHWNGLCADPQHLLTGCQSMWCFRASHPRSASASCQQISHHPPPPFPLSPSPLPLLPSSPPPSLPVLPPPPPSPSPPLLPSPSPSPSSSPSPYWHETALSPDLVAGLVCKYSRSCSTSGSLDGWIWLQWDTICRARACTSVEALRFLTLMLMGGKKD